MDLITLAIEFMKIQSPTKNIFFVAMMSIIFGVLLIGCSDDEEKKLPVKTSFNPFDHSHDVPVTDVQKHKFEHDFAEQCVARELKNSVNIEEDKVRFSKSCLCVANYMLKDLTDEEAEKFLTEHENPRSLQIKYNSAAYHCAQQQPLAKGFKTFEAPAVKKEEGFFSKFF